MKIPFSAIFAATASRVAGRAAAVFIQNSTKETTMKPAVSFIFSVILAVPPLVAAHQGDSRHAQRYYPFPLIHAIEHDDYAKVRRLLDGGANVNVTNNRGETALHLAAGKNAIEIVELLIDNEANVNAKGALGETALHWAAETNAEETAKLLISSGANVNAKDKDGAHVLHWASQNNADKIVKLLRDKGAYIEVKRYKAPRNKKNNSKGGIALLLLLAVAFYCIPIGIAAGKKHALGVGLLCGVLGLINVYLIGTTPYVHERYSGKILWVHPHLDLFIIMAVLGWIICTIWACQGEKLEKMQKCPDCRADIPAEASVCMHCRCKIKK